MIYYFIIIFDDLPLGVAECAPPHAGAVEIHPLFGVRYGNRLIKIQTIAPGRTVAKGKLFDRELRLEVISKAEFETYQVLYGIPFLPACESGCEPIFGNKAYQKYSTELYRPVNEYLGILPGQPFSQNLPDPFV